MLFTDLRDTLMDVAAKAIVAIVILAVVAALIAVDVLACGAGQAWIALATFMAVPLLALAIIA